MAARVGRPAVILEKDIWICWVLRTVFSIPNAHPMAFKGGTSLSKVYRIIDRFSEDIDITLDYREFGHDFDPFAPGVSRTRIDKFSQQLKSCVVHYARDVVRPALKAEADRLGMPGQHEVRVDANGEEVRFSYPSRVEDQAAYLHSEVRLEFGGRNVTDPNERHQIAPDIAAFTPEIKYPIATAIVLSPLRTFWEKVTLIHVECHRPPRPAGLHRLSRHWFDLTCLAADEAGQTALSDHELLEDVVRVKKLFFNASYAQYDRCLDGHLQLVPDRDRLDELRNDYAEMRAAGMVKADAPDFNALIERLRELETQMNDRP